MHRVADQEAGERKSERIAPQQGEQHRDADRELERSEVMQEVLVERWEVDEVRKRARRQERPHASDHHEQARTHGNPDDIPAGRRRRRRSRPVPVPSSCSHRQSSSVLARSGELILRRNGADSRDIRPCSR